MKRDDDLLRQLLLEMESSEEWLFDDDPGEGQLDERRAYHLHLLNDLGFVSRNRFTFRMTARGHDYLDAVRDEGVWAKTKRSVQETGGSATVEIIKEIAIAFLKKKLSDHTGLSL